MYDEANMLTDTFEAHEHLAPAATDVLANADAIARNYRRNRWIVRATGVSLVSAGIVAGSVALPGLVSNSSSNSHATLIAPAAQDTSATYTQDQEISAYLQGGYDYTNALKLAKLWNMPTVFINKVKAKAGLKLLQGQSLPVTPDGAPATPEDKAVAAFFNAGYDYNDAVTLAQMWHDKNTYQAKVQGGTKIESGETLPIQPSGTADNATVWPAGSPNPAALTKARSKAQLARMKALKLKGAAPLTASSGNDGTLADQKALAAYFNAGYDYSDAQQLAQIWHETDITQVKTEAGQKLLDGDTLPVKPSGTPASPEDQAVSAFFNAGYDYNDAVKLGQMWHESNIYQVKIEAGKKLEAGQTLPIQPGS